MRLRPQVFHLPKAGNQWEEYEDAWDCDQRAGRLAVADGASDAFEARRWAQVLVKAFTREPPMPDREAMLRWLESPIQAWRDGIPWDELPWYGVEKARRGAFSTLLGMEFAVQIPGQAQKAASSAHWSALAVGDACFFQVRRGKMVAHFPVEKAADFGITPALLSTRPDYNHHSLEELQSCEGECRVGELFVLATDALAHWFLRRVEAGEKPWQALRRLTMGEFARLVERLRREEVMRNDDVTLLLVRVERGETDPKGS